jgi:adenine-specific DNA methylase
MKRFIEVSFPVKEVGEHASREKNIRQGHISTLHIWWARKPLASSRATSYASLIPSSEASEDWERKKQFIIELSKWKNSLNPNYIEKARRDILKAYGGKPPKVLDPFAGGGAIPLEALRLGCETYASDYNPVAVLILKCTLEYPQMYGKAKGLKKDLEYGEGKNFINPLVEDVKKWGKRILEEAEKEIEKFYPPDPDDSIPVGYYWMRTIPCQNPSCYSDIPLTANLWLAKKGNKKVALKPYVQNGKVEFEIVGQDNPLPKGFDPQNGTVRRAVAKCLVCGSTIDDKTVRKLFREGKASERMVAVVFHYPKKMGKTYRIATERDLEVFHEAEKCLQMKRKRLMDEWGIDPVPNEPTPEGKGRGAERAFSVRNYAINTWADLFNSRQKLALITFVNKIKQAYKIMIKEEYDENLAKALISYLAITLNNIVEKNNSTSRWAKTKETIAGSFSRMALPIIWDYFESNPFSKSTGDWLSAIHYNLNVLSYCSYKNNSANINQCSATLLPYSDCYFDAVFTDPPYYDNVPYSYLSDFFYVWLKRSIGDLYPDLFSTPLTPKSKEIVAYTHDKSWKEAKILFEDNLKKSFKEIHRILKPNGIATIVYAHKSTSGWETLINSLLDSGLIITASWPIHTEMKGRLRAKESATLASSIYIICRKMERIKTGWHNDVKEEIKKHIYQKLEHLWNEGISGADYFIAAIGSAIEIFGKYEKVVDFEGNIIRADKLIDFVRDVVTDYAVRQILHDGITGELSPLTKFYILFRWTYPEAKVHFDDARKLAQSTGIDLTREWNKGFIKKEKEFIRVLGPHERNNKEIKSTSELIDALHQSLILWKEGKREDIKKVLQESGWGTKDAFFRVAQAISETLPNESKEKKLLDGFLSGKERIVEESKQKQQGKLDL